MPYTRKEVLSRLRQEAAGGKIIGGGSAGTGDSAKAAEAGGADLIVVYNSDRYKMPGGNLLAGLLPYGDANGIVADLGREVLSAAGMTPVIAGVCGTDPFRIMDVYLKQLKEQGFSGVQNFPTVGLYDGAFRANLEEAGMGYALEVEMIGKARRLDLFTCPFVFNREEARSMAAAGADCLVVHLGLVTNGPIGIRKAQTFDDGLRTLREIGDAARSENPELIVMCHGGLLAEPEQARRAVAQMDGLHGYFDIPTL